MKKAGNYRSIIRGVSEQSPELRPVGQVSEQINMIPDPREGLVRRWGSVFQTEQGLLINPTADNIALMRQDTDNWKSYDFFAQGKDYTMLLRRSTKPVGSPLPAALVYNRTDKQFCTYTRNAFDLDLDTFENGGASAVTSIGKYVFMAGNDSIPQASTTDVWGSMTNLSRALVWVRGGAYARTYKVTVTKFDNTQTTFLYKTPTASYQTPLIVDNIPNYIADPAGASTQSVPISTGATQVFSPGGSAVEGATVGLVNTPVETGSVSMYVRSGSSSDSYKITYLIEGVHYTMSGNNVVFTNWTAGADVPNIGLNNLMAQPGAILNIYYRYTTGGSVSVPLYVFETLAEPLYLKEVGTSAVANLTFKDWAPKNLSVTVNGQLLGTAGTLGALNPNNFYWPGGSAPLIFHKSLIGNGTVVVKYDHYKTLINPNYAKTVADATSAYNSAVTAWIGSAAKAIAPGAIAIELQKAAVAAGLTGVTVQGPNVIFTTVKSIAVDDEGDGSLIRGVADEVASVDDVSTTHYVGKVVKVRAKNASEVFYLTATAKDRNVVSGYTEVIWVEGAGTVFQVTSGLIYAQPKGVFFYVASSAAGLNTLTGETAPSYDASTAGDVNTNPLPYFVGRKITMLTTFQDRLLVGSEGVIRASKTAEYLNFFRSSVVTEPSDDAMEFMSQSSSSDVLMHSKLWDKNLVIFGLKRQYLINGNVPLTPTNANMVVLSNHQNAAEVEPIEAGGFLFYAKGGSTGSSVHQIQPGLNTNSPSSFDISSQLSTYLSGTVIELSQIPKPATLFIRTTGKRGSVYLFSYLDVEDGRKQDAWHRFDYNPELGPVVGMQPTAEGMLVFSLRTGNDLFNNPNTWLCVDLQQMQAGLSDLPYLDSIRPAAFVDFSGGGWMQPSIPDLSVAFDKTTEYRLLGDLFINKADLYSKFPLAVSSAWAGIPFESSVTPSNPFVKNEDGAILEGRLTVAKFEAGFKNSSGHYYDVIYKGATDTYTFNGRILGDPNNTIGRTPISDYQQSLPVGRETRDFTLSIRSRSWYPLQIKTLTWVGQFFNRTQY